MHSCYNKQTLEKTEGAIPNGRSRNTGNIIRYTRYRKKQHKTTQYIQKTKKVEQTLPKKTGVNIGGREGW